MIEKKLHELGNGNFAYTQLPGTWGWSNAGLITDGDQSLLVDTLFDRKMTRDMLAAMRRATKGADNIGTVVNTHGNGDHCYGNGVIGGAKIVATEGCKQDLQEAPASRNALLLKAARVAQVLGGPGRVIGRLCGLLGVNTVGWLMDAAPFALPLFEHFEFEDNETVLPTHTFTGSLTLQIGDKPVELIELGPAHTLGDAVVYVPNDKLLFTGDILFKDAHPVIWQGPVYRWIEACDRLLKLDVETVVPGHGPLTDLSGIRETHSYLRWLTEEAKNRYNAGMDVDQAARDIALGEYAAWMDAERIFVNVHTLYRDFTGDRNPPHILEMLAGMGRLARSTSTRRVVVGGPDLRGGLESS